MSPALRCHQIDFLARELFVPGDEQSWHFFSRLERFGTITYRVGFLDSVFFVLPPFSLDSILLVNIHRQALCLRKDLLVLNSFFLGLEFCFAFNFRGWRFAFYGL